MQGYKNLWAGRGFGSLRAISPTSLTANYLQTVGDINALIGLGDITQSELDAAGVTSEAVSMLQPPSGGPNMTAPYYLQIGGGGTSNPLSGINWQLLLLGGILGMVLFQKR